MKNVVYACNNNYIEQTIVSMASLLKTNSYPMKLWVVSDCITEGNRTLILDKTSAYQREIEFLEIDDVLKGVLILGEERHPRTVYAKLFLEDIIEADKLLYMDSDTIICENLEELWVRDMEGELVAGVQMPYSDKVKLQMNISNGSPYICDGVVLLNLALWRQKKVGERCKTYIAECCGTPAMLSEGTLNYVCQSYIGVLKPRYNLMPSMLLYTETQIKKLFKVKSYYSEQELAEARKSPSIVHFINELYNRPWYDPCDHPYKHLYREERQRIFGALPYKQHKQAKNTMLTRKLRDLLPFCVFAGLYHYKHKEL